MLLATAGLGRTIVDVSARTLLQRVAPSDMLARVFGLVEALAMAALAVGSLLVAALVAIGGVSLALVGIGLLLPLTLLAFGRSLLDVDRHATVPVVQIGLLRSLPLFAPLPPQTLESAAHALERLDVPAGTVVIREGEDGDRFYVIADGSIQVTRAGHVLATLERGDGFGEVALLRSSPRNATCTAITEATLYALEREEFLAVVTGHPRSEEAAERLAATALRMALERRRESSATSQSSRCGVESHSAPSAVTSTSSSSPMYPRPGTAVPYSTVKTFPSSTKPSGEVP